MNSHPKKLHELLPGIPWKVYVGNAVADKLAGLGARWGELADHAVKEEKELHAKCELVLRRLVAVLAALSLKDRPRSVRAAPSVLYGHGAGTLPRSSPFLVVDRYILFLRGGP